MEHHGWLLLCVGLAACGDVGVHPAEEAGRRADAAVELQVALDAGDPASTDASSLPPPTRDASALIDATTPARDAMTIEEPDAGAMGMLGDPGAAGPYGVGVRTLELTDSSRSRTMLVDVWYPIAAGQPCATPNTYALGERVTLFEVETPACRDAPPVDMSARPIIIFSHGFGGIRFQSYFLTEHWASHGFLVAAPDHPGNRLTDFGDLGNDDAAAQSAMDRPLDVLFVLDHFANGGEPTLPPPDMAHVATSGHSFGGWTTLETARRDPRIGAVVPLAPGFRGGATIDFVADLRRPALIVGGSVDSTCDFEPNQQAPYDIAATPKALLKVIGAGHLDFSNLCEIPIARLFIDDGCDPMNIEPSVVQARVKTVSTAFLLRYLRGQLGAEPYLDETFVEALGQVEFSRAP